jgi:hypothetical protein
VISAVGHLNRTRHARYVESHLDGARLFGVEQGLDQDPQATHRQGLAQTHLRDTDEDEQKARRHRAFYRRKSDLQS